jgi:hypothetical protein
MAAKRKNQSKKKSSGKNAHLRACCDHQITDPPLLTAPALALKGVSNDAQGSYISDVRGNLETGCGPLTAVLAKVYRINDPIPNTPPNPPPPNGADTPHTATNTNYYFKRVHGATVGTDNLLVVWTRCGASNVWVTRTRQFEGT